MSKLSLMILCGRSPRHLYVANRLCRAGVPLCIVQEVGREWTKKKIFNLLKPRNLWRTLRQRYHGMKRNLRSAEAEFFFGDRTPRLERSDLLVEVPHINHPDVVALAEKHKPDVIAVFGTSLIRGELLQKGRLGIINLHGGLSPHYRGADCTFWALYNGQPDQVGCTLHFIDRGIDTGKLIAHVCPEIDESGDEMSLFFRAVRDSAEAYGELLDRMERGEKLGQVQTSKGQLYQVKDRTWRHDLELARKLKTGLLRGVRLPQRTKWFSV